MHTSLYMKFSFSGCIQIKPSMATSNNIDVSTKEPLGDINRMAPQLYIFGKLASVTSKTTGRIRNNNIEHLHHSLHKEDLDKVMNESDRTINFKGHEIVYRMAEMQHSCYIIDNYRTIQDRSSWTWIDRDRTTPLTGIKLLHFATRPFSSSRYGDHVCTTPYNVVMTKYLQARKHYSKEKDKIKSVTYRVACTQIHKKEINHMVMICCDGDKEELRDFPILEPQNQTQHFTPTREDTVMETRYSARMSQNLYTGNQRHEELTLSFYLPDECQLSLSQEDYTLRPVQHDADWCHKILKTPYFTGQCPSQR